MRAPSPGSCCPHRRTHSAARCRWVIVDLVGKGGRVRSVPMPSWTKSAIDAWIETAEVTCGTVFRAITKGGRISATKITARGIFAVVQRFGAEIGVPKLAPHDLRLAKLATQRESWSRTDPIELRARFPHDNGALSGREAGSHRRPLRPPRSDG